MGFPNGLGKPFVHLLYGIRIILKEIWPKGCKVRHQTGILHRSVIYGYLWIWYLFKVSKSSQCQIQMLLKWARTESIK